MNMHQQPQHIVVDGVCIDPHGVPVASPLHNQGGLPMAGEPYTAVPQRPTDLPDGLLLDSPFQGTDTATPEDASKMSRVIAAVICVLVATVLCIVFGVVGLFSRSVVFIGPVVTMVIGLGLFASIRTTRLTVDRSARTVKHERWFVLAPCIKTTTACDLSDGEFERRRWNYN